MQLSFLLLLVALLHCLFLLVCLEFYLLDDLPNLCLAYASSRTNLKEWMTPWTARTESRALNLGSTGSVAG
jgi:hypothetical protein